MTLAARCAALAAILIAFTAGLAAAAEPGMTTYRDPNHAFSVSYPDDWQQTAFRDGPEFQAMANGGRGPEDCNVNVTSVSGPAYLDRVSRGQMLSNLRVAMHDAALGEWRRQTLQQRWGLYYVVTGTTPKQNYKQTTVGFQVVAGAKLYTISCSAPVSRFEERRALFDRVIASLAF